VSAISIRLFLGSSTPAMRAIAKPFLALALLVARVRAQDAHDAFAAHDLAVLTNLFNRRSNFHSFQSLLAVMLVLSGSGTSALAAPAFSAHPVCYPAAREVVGREFDRDLVAGQNFYVMHPHFARYMSQDFVPIVERHPEHRIGEGFLNRPLYFYRVALRHLPIRSEFPARWR